MATRGKQIIPTVDWHTPDVDPMKSWGAQTEASDKMRHSFNDNADGTPAIEQDKQYILVKQVPVQIMAGVVGLATAEAVVPGSFLVSPGAQMQTTYERKDFGYVMAIYEALP